MIEMLSQYFSSERTATMNIIYAEYNIDHNSIDITTTAGYLFRIDCWEAEKGLKTTPCSECPLITHQQNRTKLSTAARSGVHFTVDCSNSFCHFALYKTSFIHKNFYWISRFSSSFIITPTAPLIPSSPRFIYRS